MAIGQRCSPCPEQTMLNTILQIDGVVLLAVGGAAAIYKLAGKGSLEEDEQAMESSRDSAKAAAKDLKSIDRPAVQAQSAASTASTLSILFPSFQFSMLTWSLDMDLPVFMESITTWLGNVALPDFGAVLSVECNSDALGGTGPSSSFAHKFAGKQGMFFSLVVVYGLIYLFYLANDPERKRRAVQAMGASYW